MEEDNDDFQYVVQSDDESVQIAPEGPYQNQFLPPPPIEHLPVKKKVQFSNPPQQNAQSPRTPPNNQTNSFRIPPPPHIQQLQPFQLPPLPLQHIQAPLQQIQPHIPTQLVTQPQMQQFYPANPQISLPPQQQPQSSQPQSIAQQVSLDDQNKQQKTQKQQQYTEQKQQSRSVDNEQERQKKKQADPPPQEENKPEKKKKTRLQNALYLDDELPDSRLNGSKYNRERYKQFRHIDAMVAYYEEKKLKKQQQPPPPPVQQQFPKNIQFISSEIQPSQIKTLEFQTKKQQLTEYTQPPAIVHQCRRNKQISLVNKPKFEKPFSEFVENLPTSQLSFWQPIVSVQQIPQTFFISEPFEKPEPPPKPASPYDAFRLFFDEEIYEILTPCLVGSNNQVVLDAFFASEIYTKMASGPAKVTYIMDHHLYRQIRRNVREQLDTNLDYFLTLNNNFRHAYSPQEFLVLQQVDENLYQLCDAITGYTIEVFDSVQNVESSLEEFKWKNHKLIADPKFVSMEFITELKHQKVGFLGLLTHERSHLTRNETNDQHFQKIYKNEYASYLSKDGEMIMLYFLCESEECGIVSSFIDNSQNYLHNISKNHYRQNQPYMVHIYNKFHTVIQKRKKFVDKYIIKEQTAQRKLLERMLEYAIINGAILMKEDVKKFRRSLIKNLIQRYRNSNPPPSVPRTHKQIGGDILVNCVECGAKCYYICQECTTVFETLIGICKKYGDRCLTEHVGYQSLVPVGSIALTAEDILKKAIGRRTGLASTWAQIKSLKETKVQLETDNEKINQGTVEYMKAIQLLNETLCNLTSQQSKKLVIFFGQNRLNQEISEEISDLIHELQSLIPKRETVQAKQEYKIKKTDEIENKFLDEEEQREMEAFLFDDEDKDQQEDDENEEEEEKKNEGQEEIKNIASQYEEIYLREQLQYQQKQLLQQIKEKQQQEEQEMMLKQQQEQQQMQAMQGQQQQNPPSQQQSVARQQTNQAGGVKNLKMMGKSCKIIQF